MSDPKITLYYAPRTRSFTALWLLEELGVPYDIEVLNLYEGEHKRPEMLALNPMGKVPVIVDGDLPASELGAIAIYLADRYPEAELAPAIDDPDRPAYLRWAFFASAIIEPALGQAFYRWEIPPHSAAWGSFEQMRDVATAAVEDGDWLLGDRFSAADVLVASGLRFGLMFGVLPKEGPIPAYVERATSRDAFKRATEIEQRESKSQPRPDS